MAADDVLQQAFEDMATNLKHLMRNIRPSNDPGAGNAGSQPISPSEVRQMGVADLQLSQMMVDHLLNIRLKIQSFASPKNTGPGTPAASSSGNAGGFSGVGNLVGKFAETLTNATSSVAGFAGKMVGAGAAFTGAIGAKFAANPIGSSLPSVGDVTSPVKSAGNLAAPIAAPMQAIQGIGGQISQFVDALNPALVAQFGRAMRDLTATIGVALEPAFKVLTTVTRQLGAVLLPIMQKLAPIVQQFGEMIGKVAGTYLNAFASVLQTLMPVFQMFADVMDALTPVLQAGIAIYNGLFQAIASVVRSFAEMLGLDMESGFKTFREGMEKLAEYAILAGAALMRWISPAMGAKFIEGLRTALTGQGVDKKDNTGIAAAINPTIGNLASFGQTVSRASLIAGSAATDQPKTTEQWLEQTLKQLETMEKGGKTSFDELRDKLVEAISNLPKNIAIAIAEGTSKAVYDKVESIADDAVMTGKMLMQDPLKFGRILIGME
jgi:hypothetical protein